MKLMEGKLDTATASMAKWWTAQKQCEIVDACLQFFGGYGYMMEFPKDRNYRATMHRCRSSIGRAMYYTTLTVVVGFSMLTLSNFTPSIYFGLLTVLAMAAAVIGALLLLPQLIILLKPLGPEGD